MSDFERQLAELQVAFIRSCNEQTHTNNRTLETVSRVTKCENELERMRRDLRALARQMIRWEREQTELATRLDHHENEPRTFWQSLMAWRH